MIAAYTDTFRALEMYCDPEQDSIFLPGDYEPLTVG